MQTKLRILRSTAAALAFSLIAACSAGGGSNGGPATSPVAKSDASSSVHLIITVPNAAPLSTASARSAKYISPATQSLSIVEDGGTSTVVNLTKSSAGCTTNSTGLVCDASASVVPGTHDFTLAAFDATNGSGNKLSQTTISGVNIVAGITNSVPIALGGIVASVVIKLSDTSPVSGTPATIGVSVNAKDASGNTIIGSDPYSSPITLTNTDGSGAAKLSTANITAPTTVVSLAYNGSPALASATISATVPGVLPAKITPATLKPVTVSSGGSEAIVVVPKGASTFAIVPATGGVAVVDIADGSTLKGIARAHFVAPSAGATAPIIATKDNQRSLGAAFRAAKYSVRAPQSSLALKDTPVPPTIIPVSPQPDECAADYSALIAYCINYGSNVVTKLDLSLLKQVASYTTDAGTKGDLSFSGGTCTICGVVYDTRDSAFVISSPNGYEMFNANTGNLIKTIAEPAGENFGYNPVTDQVLSPEYANGVIPMLALIDLPTGNVYDPSFSLPGLNYPDSAAFDPSTNTVVAPEEFNTAFYTIGLTGTTLTAPSGGKPGQFGAAINRTLLTSSVYGLQTDLAVDSQSHIVFDAGEFGNNVGAVQLPATASANPAPIDWVFTTLPADPNGEYFAIPGDPHATATFNLSGQPLGLTFNSTETYVAVLDMKKLLAAPRSSADLHTVDPTYDLVANGILHYDPI